MPSVKLRTTRPVLDRFHDSSIPPSKCAKSSESVPKPEKVWIIAIFAVQMGFLQSKCYFFWCAEQKKFERAVQTFATWWREFCCLMARVLPQYKLLLPYGASFAALWREFCRLSSVLINRAQYKILDPNFGGGGVCVKVSPRTACCCQKCSLLMETSGQFHQQFWADFVQIIFC